jgi:hypothetical protein
MSTQLYCLIGEIGKDVHKNVLFDWEKVQCPQKCIVWENRYTRPQKHCLIGNIGTDAHKNVLGKSVCPKNAFSLGKSVQCPKKYIV